MWSATNSLMRAPQADIGESLPPMHMGKISARDQFLWVAKNIHERVKLLHILDIDEYFYKPEDSPLFVKLEETKITKWVRDIWLKTFGSFSPKDVKDAIEVVKIMTEQEVDTTNSNYIYICPGVYWDKSNGELTEEPLGPVFYRLFDTTYPDRHNIAVRPFTNEEKAHLLDKYEQVKQNLMEGKWECEYEFINVWANNNPEIAQDFIRMNAYCYLNKKPLGSGILIGLRRNGKSTFVDMLHTQFGANNTSRVQLSQLGDPHYTHTLRFSLLNAPDEEEEKAVSYQGLFKTMSDHGILTLPVMRSNVPVKVPCDFMSFFPMNHTPEWTGSGASACVSRSLIMPFENDLSKYDKVSSNFGEETFTAEMFSDYLGTVFAYAWWYHRHDHEFSNRMKEEQATIQQDLDSSTIYRTQFEKFFDGFESLKTVYEDYQFWCHANEVRISTYKQFKFVFKPYMAKRSKYNYRGKLYNVYRYVPEGSSPSQPMLNFHYAADLGHLEDLHKKGLSIIERANNRYGAELYDLNLEHQIEEAQSELFD